MAKRKYYVEYSGHTHVDAASEEEAVEVAVEKGLLDLDLYAYTASEWREYLKNQKRNIQLTEEQYESLRFVIHNYLKYLHCNTMVDSWKENAPKYYEILKTLL